MSYQMLRCANIFWDLLMREREWVCGQSSVTSRARSRDRTPTSDPDRTHRTSWTSLRTFCSTYMLLTHYLHVSLGPHSGLRLSPDTGPTPLHHPVYPSALPTLFVFTRLHPLPCTGP